MYIVFVAGPSGAGKTTFTEILNAQLKELKITSASIRLDDYYKEIPDGVDFKEYKEKTNFDDPDRLRLDILLQDIIGLQEKGYIKKPVFDFKTEKINAYEVIRSADFLIVEGSMALYFYDKYKSNFTDRSTVYVEAKQETLLNRRLTRDIERGYTEDEIRKKDTEIIWPACLKFIAPTSEHAKFHIQNNDQGDHANLRDTAAKIVHNYQHTSEYATRKSKGMSLK